MAKHVTQSGFRDWSLDKLPNLTDRTYLITGGNTGIGFAAGQILAHAGANIVIGSRSPEKGRLAAERLARFADGQIDHITLDLTSMRSVRSAAEDVRARYDGLDALICNAGIMQTPQRMTRDGFELQLATNHLSHFLLSALLFNHVERVGGRFVTVGSVRHKLGTIDFDDLMLKRSYTPTRSYTRSKLANLLFAFELDRRLKRAQSPAMSVACHPGFAVTKLNSNAPEGVWPTLYKIVDSTIAQTAQRGAVPTVLAAAGREARPGGYYGPQDVGETRGRISDATVSPQALDEEAAARLWRESERLLGIEWDGASPARDLAYAPAR